MGVVKVVAYIILLIIAWYLMSGCAADQKMYVELGAGKNTSFLNESQEWNDGGGVGFYGSLRYERPINERANFVAHYAHYSQWNVGPPFNDDAESSLDHVGVALQWRLTP